MTATPRELRALRMQKNMTIFDAADVLGLDPLTLAALEDGSLKASDDLLADWERTLSRLRSKPHFWRLRRFVKHNPSTAVAVAALAAVTMIGCTVLMHGGR
jgi:transcriptional regulator with XRE-family HTH domain